MIQNLRMAGRALRKNPGYTAVAVGTLGLGMAATITVFTWVNAFLLQPIPGVSRPGELAAIEEVSPQGDSIAGAHADFRDFQSQMTLASGVVASHFMPFTLGRDQDAQRVYGQVVSANFFRVLGVKPIVGRVFDPDEDRDSPGAYPLAVISESLWNSRYHGDPAVLNRPVVINGRSLRIIGVTPEAFHGTMGGLKLDVWVPLSQAREMGAISSWTGGDHGSKYLDIVARLKPGVSVRQADQEIRAIFKRIAEAYPAADAGVSARVLPLWAARSGAQMLLLDPLRILMGVAGLVLLIACANVANLALARSVTRRREFGVRMALGAAPARIVGQLLTEILLLSAGGALLGIWVSQWSGAALSGLLPKTDLPIAVLYEPLKGGADLRVWLFAFAACAAAAALSAIAPVLYAGRLSVNDSIQQGGRTGSAGARSHRARSLLVVFEVALASLALIGAGLFARSFQNARAIHTGFEPGHVMVAHLFLSAAGYKQSDERQFDRALRDRLAGLPGIEEAAYCDWVPLWFGEPPWAGIRIPGRVQESDIRMARMLVSPGYFHLMRIPIISGRDFTEQDSDAADSSPVIMVNQEFARRYLGDRDPVGSRVMVDGVAKSVVGMVRDFKLSSPAEEPRPYFYAPFRQAFHTGHNNFVYVRTAGDPASAAAALRREISALDPMGDLFEAAPMTTYTEAALYPQRVAATLLMALGALSMLLAGVGLYSVMSYSVSERTQEIGIRMALGARSESLLGMIIGQGFVLIGTGMAIGIAASFAMTRLVASFLIHVSAADPRTFGATAVILGIAGLLASYIPARRAMRLDPLDALHRE
jgi:predicted permease